jgi:DNA-binding MarR family transcriptional regulator
MAMTKADDIRGLVEQVGRHVRRMGAQSVITSQVVADRFSLHTTDLECLDLIYLRKDVTAGELAKATGLTSGAVTALIDRLEAAGYVERAADSADRRRVLVRIKPDAIKPIEAVYAPMQEKMFALWSAFSERDLRVIADFISRSTDLAVSCADEISRGAPAATPKRRPARAGRLAPAKDRAVVR